MTTNGNQVPYCGDNNVLKLAVIVVQLCEYTKNYSTVHFIRVNFMVCELYFNKAVTKSSLFDFLVLMTKQIKISIWY